MLADPRPHQESRSHWTQLDRVLVLVRTESGGVGGLLALLVILAGAFSLLMPGTFPRASTLQAMMYQIPELGLLSLAMAIPLISGGINLAVVATANAASILMAWLLTAVMPSDAAGLVLAGWIVCAVAAGFIACLAIGLFTGLLVARAGVHPILVTLGTMTLLHGLSVDFTRGRSISGFPEPLLAISNVTFFGAPLSFLAFLLFALALHVLLTRSALGVRIHMIGSNLEATRYSGVDTGRVVIWTYVLSSLLSWLAALVMMARFNSAGADIAQSYLLVTVLASILGGVDPYGGFGRIPGLFIALCVLQVVASGFNLMDVSPHLSLASWGALLLIVMAVKRFGPSLGVQQFLRRRIG